MRPDLYQSETARIASAQGASLEQARAILAEGRALSPLDQSGVLHGLQVLAENAIGKAKQLLNLRKQPVPLSAYDAFNALASAGVIHQASLPSWNPMIGLRNRIVHDYMNIDMDKVIGLLLAKQDQFIVDFLVQPASASGN